MNTPAVVRQGPGILAPSGASTMLRCVAWRCGVSSPQPFCRAHFARVPHHLRQAILEDLKWLKSHKAPADAHFMALLNVAANRELALRVLEDPKAKAEWEEAEAEAKAKQKASNAGIVGPNGRPLAADQAAPPTSP
jgi:hypothetical protein